VSNLKAYEGKRLCNHLYEDGITCKCLALSYSDKCRHHHKTEDVLPDLTEHQQSRYTSANQTVRQRINSNLASPTLLDLRHEIALLQNWLQELLDSPVKNFDKQLQVIDRIERLVTNFQRVRLSAQALAQAENKVRLVINNLVLIIKDVVTNKEQRQEIARRISELGNEYESRLQDALLKGNTEDLLIQDVSVPGLSINTSATQAPTQDTAPSTVHETGGPGRGDGIDSEIPSPCPDASSLVPPEIPSKEPGVGA
jgi:hypothetical protein